MYSRRRSYKKRKCTSAAVAGTEITGGSIAFYPTLSVLRRGRNPRATPSLSPLYRYPYLFLRAAWQYVRIMCLVVHKESTPHA